jgi:hypothetical protein
MPAEFFESVLTASKKGREKSASQNADIESILDSKTAPPEGLLSVSL